MPAQLLKTYSPTDASFAALEGTAWRESFLDWVKDQGIDPHKVGAIEVWDTDGNLSARVAVYLEDAEGRKMVVPGTEYYAQTVETVALSSMPPEQPPVIACKTRPIHVSAARLTRLRAASVASWVADGGKNDVTLHVPDDNDPDGRAWLDIHGVVDVERAHQGDWIVREANGYFHPVTDEEFRCTYLPSS